MNQLATKPTDQLHTRGTAQKRDRDLLLLLALFAPHEKQNAVFAWNALAPRAYRGLLSAQPSTPYSAPAGLFWFDPDRAQFAHGTRGYIPDTAIRSALNTFNHNAAAELANMTESAADGLTSLGTWQDAMTAAVKRSQLVNAAVGRGGVVQLSDGDLSQVSDTLIYQFWRLDRFAGQLADDVGEMAPARAASRAGAYALSAVSTYDGMRRRSADVAGYLLEKNFLGISEHCAFDPNRPDVPDCPSLSRLGWMPLGTIPKIGTRLCAWNCHCHVGFMRG